MDQIIGFSKRPPFFRGQLIPLKTSMGRVPKIFLLLTECLKFPGFEGKLPTKEYINDLEKKREKNFGEWTPGTQRVKFSFATTLTEGT